jgi:hypothetical protein
MRYLLVQFIRKPGGQIDEQVTVSKRVKQSDIQTMNIIMDYAAKKIDKCVVEGKVLSKDWESMNEYYRKIYPNLVAQLEKEASITAKAK